MKRLLLALVLLLSASSAFAEEKKKDEVGQNVSISPVSLPVVVDGKLVNYVFVTVRLELSASANASKLREKEPYFRDALVRAGHRTPFTLLSDLTKIDEAKLKAAMMREAAAIAGAGAVRSVTLINQAPKSLRVPTYR
jgi:flagellar basal body-associated protein FliL